MKAHKNGELPKSADPRALARFYVAVAQGMSAQASDGATMEGLRSTAELAMRAWPEGGKKK